VASPACFLEALTSSPIDAVLIETNGPAARPFNSAFSSYPSGPTDIVASAIQVSPIFRCSGISYFQGFEEEMGRFPQFPPSSTDGKSPSDGRPSPSLLQYAFRRFQPNLPPLDASGFLPSDRGRFLARRPPPFPAFAETVSSPA